uniref:Uncharacterized protein n=1 Tax=Anguilla anguilla TaxID=7936 RepID=A0A0E9QD66_ANGAN
MLYDRMTIAGHKYTDNYIIYSNLILCLITLSLLNTFFICICRKIYLIPAFTHNSEPDA